MSSTNSLYKVTPGIYPKTITVPTSKSYANRYLILAALSKEVTKVSNLSASTDVLTMLDSLRAVGLDIRGDVDEGTIEILNSFPACEPEGDDVIVLKTGDGGTTNRFILALLALGKRKYQLVTTGRMKERPSSEFFEVFEELGVNIREEDHYWCQIQGPMNVVKSEIEVDCSRSTQFATALALCLGPQNIKVTPVKMSTSRAYWEMTEELIARYMGGQRDFVIPVDFSSLTYPLALGVDAGQITISNCFEVDHFQADSAFIEMIKSVGVSIEFKMGDGLVLTRPEGRLKSIDTSIASCPDLTPTLAFLCALLDGKSVIRDTEVLIHKESDRAMWIEKILVKMGVDCRYERDAGIIEIQGPWKAPTTEIDLELPDDHRIIMMGYLFLNAAAGGTLDHATHVEKSFPNFFQIMSGQSN